MMNIRGKKLSGCSLIGLDDGVVEFYVFDGRQLKTQEIYSPKLDENFKRFQVCSKKLMEYEQET